MRFLSLRHEPLHTAACLLLAAAAIATAAWAGAARRDAAYKKSWVYVDTSNGGKQLVSGDRWDVPVDYYVDAADLNGKVTLALWGTGPFIDTPDGKYVKERGHVSLPGLFAELPITHAGAGHHVFIFTVPPDLEPVRRNTRILLIATFRDAAGKEWPWQHRAESSFIRKRGNFELESDRPGNLFGYSEPVRLQLRLKNVKIPGENKIMHYVVHDAYGDVEAEGKQSFTATSDGQIVPIELKLAKRGAFLIDADVDGWETRKLSFARVPESKPPAAAGSSVFGMTCEESAPPEAVWAVAQRLGLTVCRRFVPWYRLEPAPGVYKLDELSAEIDAARKHGVREWLCIGDPPPFAFAGSPRGVSYNAFDFKDDVWQEFVKTVTERLKGRLLGWEWLNEITPGGAENPVSAYVRFCREGDEAAKAVDPHITSILAGGLWPRSFRNAVLAEGIGKYVDALPVHYQNGSGIEEARQDLNSAGRQSAVVWEDESSHGINAWGVPPLEELHNTAQCEWVLRQWPDELAAGSKTEIYFGGTGDAAGSWDYALDDLSPRPVAVTIAVLTDKLGSAKPLGVFHEGAGLFHLFDRGGQPVMVASTSGPNTTVALHVGARGLTVTDYQGNETHIQPVGGAAQIAVGRLPVFIEGADADAVRAYASPDIAVAHVGEGVGAGVEQAGAGTPRVSMLQGASTRLPVTIRNLWSHTLTGSLKIETLPGWPAVPAVQFTLPPGKSEVRQIPVAIPQGASAQDYAATVVIHYADVHLPEIDKPVVFSVISRDMLGNLMPDGDFETPDAAGKGPEGFAINGSTRTWALADGLTEGLGKHVLEFKGTNGWDSTGRTIPVRGGQTYLYTAWVRNKNMQAGSNMTLRLKSGKEIPYYDVSVFTCGENNPYWQMFTCRKATPPDTESISFVPVANGAGWADFDNVRVTIYEGSDYAAEGYRAKSPPAMSGSLEDWNRGCPIPLIGRNQLSWQAPGYNWTPDNLSAVAYLMWDTTNLYLAVIVKDDVHHAMTATQPDGKSILDGDCVVLAIDPTRRGPDAATRSMEFYLSSAAPGSGSGSHTLFRPAEHAGGKKSGHLLRDSSIYDMSVKRSDGSCLYRLRIPLAELGIEGAVGTKIGLSLQVNDNDGARPAAKINWGGGLSPAWDPMNFGIVTLVE